MVNFPHLFYSGQPQETKGFKRTRGRGNDKNEKPDEPLSDEKKYRLAHKLSVYLSDVEYRLGKKTLKVPANFDLIRIDFHTTFDQILENHFYSTYGLDPIEKSNFNKNVLFRIVSMELFKSFSEHISAISRLKTGEDHRKQPFSRLALISDFCLFNDNSRKGVLSGQEGFILSFCDLIDNPDAQAQLAYLKDFLAFKEVQISEVNEVYNLLFLKNGYPGLDQILVENFDIIRLITSARVPLIKPGTVATPIRSFGFRALVDEKLPIVCIVDTGVQSNLEPLRDLCTGISVDHTNSVANWDDVGHGTAVAGLIAFGTDFFDITLKEIQAKAKLAIIKAIHQENDDLNVVALLKDIRELHLSYGIQIFNISLNLPGSKPYNGTIGRFAYELDKLAYELDILIINSVGNYSLEDLDYMILMGNLDVNTHYPAFYYQPNPAIEGHSCEFTNLQEPSEAMNILSVGALAGNFESGVTDGITPAKEYPAFYSRKSHWDLTIPINGEKLKGTQINKHLTKPDLVFEGGDYLSQEAGMEVIASPLDANSPYFARMAGTSLAAPLITSLVAQLIREYPDLKMSTIKALLINASDSPAGKRPPHFNSNDFKKTFRKLTGYGRPNLNKFLANSDNSITFVIEREIRFDQFYSFNLNFPNWVLTTSNKIEIIGTLVYTFLPIPNNHLAYLPLHISFGVFKPKDLSTLSQKDLKYYQLKPGISWAEDHFGVEDRLFSNVQKIGFNISSQHFDPNNPSVSIAMRCYGKSNIPEWASRHLKEQSHPFSLIIGLREIPKNKKSKLSGSLYNDITMLNDLQVISDLEAGSSLEGRI